MAKVTEAHGKRKKKQRLYALCDKCQTNVEEVIERRNGNLLDVTVNCHGETLIATINLKDLPRVPRVDLVFFTPEQDRAGMH